jgi:hypothetical protein
LPQRVKETAKKNYGIWKENPFHPSLEFKEVKPREKIWSVRVGIRWRALGINTKSCFNTIVILLLPPAPCLLPSLHDDIFT